MNFFLTLYILFLHCFCGKRVCLDQYSMTLYVTSYSCYGSIVLPCISTLMNSSVVTIFCYDYCAVVHSQSFHLCTSIHKVLQINSWKWTYRMKIKDMLNFTVELLSKEVRPIYNSISMTLCPCRHNVLTIFSSLPV